MKVINYNHQKSTDHQHLILFLLGSICIGPRIDETTLLCDHFKRKKCIYPTSCLLIKSSSWSNLEKGQKKMDLGWHFHFKWIDEFSNGLCDIVGGLQLPIKNIFCNNLRTARPKIFPVLKYLLKCHSRVF